MRKRFSQVKFIIFFTLVLLIITSFYSIAFKQARAFSNTEKRVQNDEVARLINMVQSLTEAYISAPSLNTNKKDNIDSSQRRQISTKISDIKKELSLCQRQNSSNRNDCSLLSRAIKKFEIIQKFKDRLDSCIINESRNAKKTVSQILLSISQGCFSNDDFVDIQEIADSLNSGEKKKDQNDQQNKNKEINRKKLRDILMRENIIAAGKRYAELSLGIKELKNELINKNRTNLKNGKNLYEITAESFIDNFLFREKKYLDKISGNISGNQIKQGIVSHAKSNNLQVQSRTYQQIAEQMQCKLIGCRTRTGMYQKISPYFKADEVNLSEGGFVGFHVSELDDAILSDRQDNVSSQVKKYYESMGNLNQEYSDCLREGKYKRDCEELRQKKISYYEQLDQKIENRIGEVIQNDMQELEADNVVQFLGADKSWREALCLGGCNAKIHRSGKSSFVRFYNSEGKNPAQSEILGYLQDTNFAAKKIEEQVDLNLDKMSSEIKKIFHDIYDRNYSDDDQAKKSNAELLMLNPIIAGQSLLKNINLINYYCEAIGSIEDSPFWERISTNVDTVILLSGITGVLTGVSFGPVGAVVGLSLGIASSGFELYRIHHLSKMMNYYEFSCLSATNSIDSDACKEYSKANFNRQINLLGLLTTGVGSLKNKKNIVRNFTEGLESYRLTRAPHLRDIRKSFSDLIGDYYSGNKISRLNSIDSQARKQYKEMIEKGKNLEKNKDYFVFRAENAFQKSCNDYLIVKEVCDSANNQFLEYILEGIEKNPRISGKIKGKYADFKSLELLIEGDDAQKELRTIVQSAKERMQSHWNRKGYSKILENKMRENGIAKAGSLDNWYTYDFLKSSNINTSERRTLLGYKMRRGRDGIVFDNVDEIKKSYIGEINNIKKTQERLFRSGNYLNYRNSGFLEKVKNRDRVILSDRAADLIRKLKDNPQKLKEEIAKVFKIDNISDDDFNRFVLLYEKADLLNPPLMQGEKMSDAYSKMSEILKKQLNVLTGDYKSAGAQNVTEILESIAKNKNNLTADDIKKGTELITNAEATVTRRIKTVISTFGEILQKRAKVRGSNYEKVMGSPLVSSGDDIESYLKNASDKEILGILDDVSRKQISIERGASRKPLFSYMRLGLGKTKEMATTSESIAKRIEGVLKTYPDTNWPIKQNGSTERITFLVSVEKNKFKLFVSGPDLNSKKLSLIKEAFLNSIRSGDKSKVEIVHSLTTQ